MILIGFGYRARQGKNTAALAVLESCPLETQVRMYAFADALRMEVRKAIGQMGGPHALISSFKESGIMPGWVEYEEPKPRKLLQWWGTDYRRAKDPEYWPKRLRKTLDEHNPEVALITDVRFPNEVAAIKSWGGYTVQVNRIGAPDIAVNDHPSEHALDGFQGWDYRISAATLSGCQAQAIAVYRDIVRKHALPGS